LSGSEKFVCEKQKLVVYAFTDLAGVKFSK